jgi:hypothetical protein
MDGDDDDDDDDDLQWVRALTVPMHLGLIVSPFLSHNMILGQDSPVPFSKFQMAMDRDNNKIDINLLAPEFGI